MNKIFIHQDITPNNAKSNGYEWLYDDMYNSDTPKAAIEYLEKLVNKGYIFGKPANNNITKKGAVGIYKKIKENIPFPEISVRWNLNPNNAKDLGFEFIGDVYYAPEPDVPYLANKEALESIEKGYIFGEPTNANTIQNGFIGIYRKLQLEKINS
jgi:hypothetical protein